MNEKSKQTQGHDKMLLYLEELIRNKHFRMLAKRLKRLTKVRNSPQGMYAEWTPEEQKEHDRINNEIGSLIDGYELLRKRCKKLFRTDGFNIREQIASYYGLDNNFINLALSMVEKDEKAIYFAKTHTEPDMCQLLDLNEEVSPYNKGEEIIWMNPVKQIFCNAYPVAIALHPKASKRDVLDYVEKRWKWIDSMMRPDKGMRALKIRKRKYSQEMMDFIWEHQTLTAKQLKAKLDEKFPRNGLVYYEISKIVQLEVDRRYRNLT